MTADSMITGNRLTDGFVVYLKLNGKEHGRWRWNWVERINEASVARDESMLEAMIAAGQRDSRQTVIEPYSIEVVEGDNGFEPVLIRERIRAFGPTVGLPKQD